MPGQTPDDAPRKNNARGGRPKKPPEQARRNLVKYRITDAAMEDLRQQATAEGVEPNECARRYQISRGTAPEKEARAGGGTSAPPPVSFEYRNEWRRVGVNMNQIAYQLNALGEYEPGELKEAIDGVNELLRLERAAAKGRSG